MIPQHAGAKMRQVGTVLGGVIDYYRRGDVSAEARRALLNLHCSTNGKFTANLAGLLRTIRPPRKARTVTGILGTLSVEEQSRIADCLRKDGFYKFEQRLSPAECDQIEAYARSTPCVVEGGTTDMRTRVLFDKDNPVSKTYRLPEKENVHVAAMQRIMGDASMLGLAETYLKTLPILANVSLWGRQLLATSLATKPLKSSFRLRSASVWLHFFIYLTECRA